MDGLILAGWQAVCDW